MGHRILSSQDEPSYPRTYYPGVIFRSLARPITVKENSGVHRYPEPKLLSGSNYCDVGFERDAHSRRVVIMAATDNLMKGAAGQAVQSFNIRMGFCETLSLEFAGLHPI